MTAQVNWKRLRSEIQRLAKVDHLKGEVARIGSEIRQFDFHSVLSPSAAQKVKHFEKRYADLMRTIHQAQRQMDREFNRILKQIKTHRTDVTKVVSDQKQKLEKVSTDFQKRFSRTAGSAAAAQKGKAKKTASKKTTPGSRKRRSAKA